MAKAFNTRLVQLALTGLMPTALVLQGCSSKDTADEVDPDVAATFTSQTGDILDSAVMDLPRSVVSEQGAAFSGKTTRSYTRSPEDEGGSHGMVEAYSGVTMYVALADGMKDFVKEMMVHIVSSPLLQLAALGEPLIIGDDGDPDGPRKVMVEKMADAQYEWKVSLYFEEEAGTPGMTVRFSLINDSAKGRLLWAITEPDERAAAAGVQVSVTRYLEVTFDGTAALKTLDIKYVGDLSEHIAYAQVNWDSMTVPQKEVLDLGQPEKVFLSATYDGSEYTIHGTSYHPGWQAQAALEGEEMFWGETRTMYMFKVKAIEHPFDGASLHLALPEETQTITDNIWTEDAIGELFTDMMLAQLNQMLSESEHKLMMLKILLGDELSSPSLQDHGTTLSQAEYDALQVYFADEPHMQGILAMSLSDLNVFFGSLDEQSDPKQSEFYEVLMTPALAEAADAHGYALSEEELEAFVARSSDNPDVVAYQQQYRSIAYIINPAFYRADANPRFLGTYDEASGQFYAFSGGTLSPSDDDSAITVLKNLDLSTIVPYAPSVVKAATITIE